MRLLDLLWHSSKIVDTDAIAFNHLDPLNAYVLIPLHKLARFNGSKFDSVIHVVLHDLHCSVIIEQTISSNVEARSFSLIKLCSFLLFWLQFVLDGQVNLDLLLLGVTDLNNYLLILL